MAEEHIQKTFYKNIQVAFGEAVGSQQIKTIGTDATVNILKEDEYVQKFGAGISSKVEVFLALIVRLPYTFKMEQKM